MTAKDGFCEEACSNRDSGIGFIEMEAGPFDRYFGVDWSGAERPSAQNIYLAEARRGPGGVEVRRLVRARDRNAVAEFLAGRPFAPAPGWDGWSAPERLDRERRALVGLDFAFGFPVRFELPKLGRSWRWEDLARWAEALDSRGLSVRKSIRNELALAKQFRLRGGDPARPYRRVTDGNVDGVRPESVLHLIGPSQVGTASITGIATINRLRRGARAAVWPFDPPARLRRASVVLVEVFPRLWLGRDVRKSELPDRVRRIERWKQGGIEFEREAELAASSSGDALDATAAAIGLARGVELPELDELPAEGAREGWIAGASVPA
jgi:hypothetical protein